MLPENQTLAVPMFKYYTPGERINGGRIPESLEIEKMLAEWFETPVSINELAKKTNRDPQSVRRIVSRAIARKPSLAGLKDSISERFSFIEESNFVGGIAKGHIRLAPDVIEAINDLRGQGMTFRDIAAHLKISISAAWRNYSEQAYRSDRAAPSEEYGLPHA